MQLEFSDGALDDLAALPTRIADQILRKIRRLENGLVGDIKHLTGAVFGYRLRPGDYRILFDLKGDTIIVQTIRHRRNAYD